MSAAVIPFPGRRYCPGEAYAGWNMALARALRAGARRWRREGKPRRAEPMEREATRLEREAAAIIARLMVQGRQPDPGLLERIAAAPGNRLMQGAA